VAPVLAPVGQRHEVACHRAAELPPPVAAETGAMAPVASRRLALYAELRAKRAAAQGRMLPLHTASYIL
jgi:hypothetical protein